MIVARQFVRDRRRALLWWSVGVTAVVVMIASTFPSLAGNQAIEDLFADLPPAIQLLAGAPEGIAITSAGGYLHSKLFALTVPMLLMIFGIGLGARAIGGDESNGTLELLLANPVTRRRVAAERLAAMTGLVVALAAVTCVVIVASNKLVGAGLESLPIGHVVAATAASAGVALVHATLAFAVGCATGKRGLAITVPAVVAVAGYLLHGLTVKSGLSAIAAASPWHWYLDRVIVMRGPSVLALTLPFAVAAALALGGVLAFERRDLR